MCFLKKILFLTLLSAACSVTYEGYKVYKVMPKTEADHNYLKMLTTNPDFDFWSRLNKVGNPVTVMASPKVQTDFEKILTANRISYQVQIENVQSTIDKEREYHRSKPKLQARGISFDQYYRHDEINAYLAQIAEDYPDLVTLETMGKSYEQRDMNLVRISSTKNSTKPIIFIDAGIHAREWIAPAVALYLINQLVENPENSYLYTDVDWIIAPSINPDGYEYSWNEDRMWRKTVSPGVMCKGCDANRNFDYHWMESGASDLECFETYAGTKAFSEPETQNLRDYLAKTPNIKAYLTLHSYGEYILYPWGYDGILCDNWEELDALGNAMKDAIKAVRDAMYSVGNSAILLYPAAGVSMDWAIGGAGINISYTLELPGGGKHGFDLPPFDIQSVVEETFEGLKVFGDYVAKNRN